MIRYLVLNEEDIKEAIRLYVQTNWPEDYSSKARVEFDIGKITDYRNESFGPVLKGAKVVLS